ncbi:MAG: hypothetical protein RR346_00970, partial [Bacteroidales bacterium]
MKTAIIDCSVSGHRETYYKQFARTLHDAGHDVVLIAPQNEGLPADISFVKINHKPELPLSECKPLQKKMRILHNALIRIENLISLKAQLSQINPDFLFFACLDDMLPVLNGSAWMDRLIPFRWSGLLVQAALPPYCKFRPDVRPALKSKNCTGVGTLNEYATKSLSSFQQRLVVFPDFADISAPAPNYQLAQQLRLRAKGRKIISLLGSIHPRKGIERYLRCCELLDADQYFFLIAGKPSLSARLSDQLKKFEEDHPNCLFSLDRIPDEPSFNALVNESDLIFAVYNNFSGSSNLLTKAAAFHKPVLVGESLCMSRRVQAYGIGISIADNDDQQCADSIRKLCYEKPISRSLFDQYIADHNANRLNTCFDRLILQPEK